MAKSNTIQVKMVSTADTGYFYVKFKIKKINNRNGKILLFKVKKLGDDAKK